MTQAVPAAPTPPEPVTLDNCAREPIHVPGHIQPHGVMLVLDLDARVTGWSANLPARLGWSPHLGQAASALPLPEVLRELMADVLAEARLSAFENPDAAQGANAAAQSAEWSGARGDWDLVVHAHDGRVLVELEARPPQSPALSSFALKAHRLIDRLKRQTALEGLLQMAAEQVRRLTDFDRVMVYRFRHDDSGDVVAEAHAPHLKPLRGMRYPASDIPAQARRLYTLNTLRLIADVGYTPVPVLDGQAQRPLDMSHAVLRSVSPVHVEYLQNMGVLASMSVSIVIDGRLWGLIACHHGRPLQVPYAVRMACDVMAQVLASSVQSLQSAAWAEQARDSAALRARLSRALTEHEDVLRAFADEMPALAELLRADAVAVSHGGKLLIHGAIDESLVRGILAQANQARWSDGLWLLQARHEWPDALRSALGPWVGLMGMPFDPGAPGWVLALRREQVETVRWGGQPDKIVQTGPLGDRLTPRGSFDEWRETVRDLAEPWEAAVRQAAREAMADLQQAVLARHAELERARTQMLAMLGHDLRDPLHSISMAAQVLERGTGAQDAQQRLGARIRSSSGRMQRLVGEVLDLSRLRSGLGLGIRAESVDLALLLRDLCDEARTAHPGVRLELQAPEALLAWVDADRLAQVLGNLLGNARHHGDPGQPIRVSLRRLAPGGVRIQVRNHAAPIPQERVQRLFEPFKGADPDRPRGHSGLGLGLYIAHEIVRGHGGSLSYRAVPPEVVFELWLPGNPPALEA